MAQGVGIRKKYLTFVSTLRILMFKTLRFQTKTTIYLYHAIQPGITDLMMANKMYNVHKVYDNNF